MFRIQKNLIILFAFCTVGAAQAIEFKLIDVEGKLHNETLYQDKYLIVNYWATWCIPCLKELPLLNSYRNQHTDKVEILGLNYQELPYEPLKEFITAHGINFPIFPFVEENDFTQFTQLQVMPTTVIFNPEGVMIERILGEVTLERLNEIIDI